jgi:hypothetical protein
VNTAPTKPARPKLDMVAMIDKSDPRQVELGLYLLRQRQKRKAAGMPARKRGQR